eukprot:s3627_g3.t1
MNHVPYRRDCLICQQTAQAAPHRRVRHPKGGTLSLDTTGPLTRAKDAEGTSTRYILVRALTWSVPAGITKLKDAQIEDDLEVPEDAPKIEEEEAKEESAGPVRVEEGSAGGELAQALPRERFHGGDQPEGSGDTPCDPRPAAEEDPERKDEEPEEFITKVFRVALPMSSKRSEEVTRTTMEIILRLRADGCYVNKIYVDKGHEFAGHFIRWIQTRGIELSRTPGDDPQGNGRAEQTVKSIKAQMRRTLLQGGVKEDKWPWVLRYINEVNRCWRQGVDPSFPPFYEAGSSAEEALEEGEF